MSRIRAIGIAFVLILLVAAMPVAADPGSLTVDLNDTDQEPDIPQRTATLADLYDNPHEATQLSVNIVYQDEGLGDHTRNVDDAIQFWNEYAIDYAGYPVHFAIVEDDPTPDITIEIEENVAFCGDLVYRPELVGCAPIVEDPYVQNTLDVNIEARNSDDRTRATIAHELGHVLGLNHGEAPYELMQALEPTHVTWPPDLR